MNPQEWLSRVARDSDVTPIQLAVATALWSFMDRQGKCFPGVETLGERAGIRKRDTVRAALYRLEDLGHLSISHQPRGRLSTNHYRAVDNSQRRPVERVTAVTRLADVRRPVSRGALGDPSNGSLTFPEGTKGDYPSGSPVDNSPHPVIAYIAETHRMP